MPTIPCPIHPDDKNLPRSDVRLQLTGGEVVEFLGVPIQGYHTLENMLAVMEIWKPNITVRDTMAFHPVP